MIQQIKPTEEFKSNTSKAIISIVFFAIVYAIIFLLAIALTTICVYGGVMLVISAPRFITIALGIGLASLGFLILFFLIKFIFKSHKIDRSHLVEITENDEPELFKMIDDIVKNVDTKFPKKVYLSSEVNASVFYDSNFWSMFFPIRKSLHIGIGLVNSVTQEELKAVLAHEFGHFSQKTMKVGSYVYNVNQVIFNMLYDNDNYDKAVQSWANVSSYIAIFVILAVKIIDGIKWILIKMYGIVNKSYMGLSREMEFHADEIAAHITGYAPLKSALLRFQLADHSLNDVLSFYDGKISKNTLSKNVFAEQHYVMQFLAKNSNLKIINDLPDVTIEELNKLNKSKLVIKDQWASHPSTEDRIERLEKTNIQIEGGNKESANLLFKNIEATQQRLTSELFKNVKFEGETLLLPYHKFQEEYKSDFLKNSFSKVYNGYYDNKNPMPIDLDTLATENIKELDSLFSDTHVGQVYTSIALQNDIESLKLVEDKSFGVKTFDYDGKKHKRRESKKLAETLSKELALLNEKIASNDSEIYYHFKSKEQNVGNQSTLKRLYQQLFDYDVTFDKKMELPNKMNEKLQFINYTTPYEDIKSNFRHLTSLERELKLEIKNLLANPKFETEITDNIKDNFDKYLSKEWAYFGSQTYFEENLGILLGAIGNYQYLLSRGYFLTKKELLDYQESLIEN
ncbi:MULTISPECIES: M48 family metalloprotease [Flavobacteriaceae]|uniref:M48 family metalloprotease n=1 Tax=Flavobacteriaceae TaxID=49546 RepID=UPI001492B3E5|nr:MULTISPECIES: M48 family metallopeptidase [Allomuricauda]MDC6365692.1 M48 family metallopeptidase [Muricauda sp. AC10]